MVGGNRERGDCELSKFRGDLSIRVVGNVGSRRGILSRAADRADHVASYEFKQEPWAAASFSPMHPKGWLIEVGIGAGGSARRWHVVIVTCYLAFSSRST